MKTQLAIAINLANCDSVDCYPFDLKDLTDLPDLAIRPSAQSQEKILIERI